MEENILWMKQTAILIKISCVVEVLEVLAPELKYQPYWFGARAFNNKLPVLQCHG